jgi:acyl-CoA thioesterase
VTALHAILAGAKAVDGAGDTWEAAIPDAWLQGRTAYGGLSTALALDCTMRGMPDLPPLRSAQVAFVGPLSGTVRVSAQALRRGRNAAFVQADVTGDAGLGLRCTFVFMRALDSAIVHDRTATAPCPAPQAGDAVLRGVPAIAFTQRFETVDRPLDDVTGWRRWVRLAERGALPPAVELLAIGDALPPAAMRLMTRPAPLSSLTWMVNLLDPAPATDDGWWLVESRTEHARDGATSQAMAIWNAAGRKVAEHMQAAAIFG